MPARTPSCLTTGRTPRGTPPRHTRCSPASSRTRRRGTTCSSRATWRRATGTSAAARIGEPRSVRRAGAFAAVEIIGDASNPDDGKLATYQFWSLGTGTLPGSGSRSRWRSPPKKPLPLPETARLFALVSVALADMVAPTVMTKFTYRHWRPATAIREADTDGNPLTDPDPSWAPRAGGIGTSPEYWSGHSSFSAAGAGRSRGILLRGRCPLQPRHRLGPGRRGPPLPELRGRRGRGGALARGGRHPLRVRQPGRARRRAGRRRGDSGHEAASPAWSDALW